MDISSGSEVMQSRIPVVVTSSQYLSHNNVDPPKTVVGARYATRISSVAHVVLS